MQDSEIRETEREFTIGSFTDIKHEAMGGAVHGFETELFLFDVKHKHLVLVVIVMTRRLPELDVEHVGRHDLRVSTLTILALDEGHQRVVNPRTMGEEETRTWREFMEEKQFLLSANSTMVPLGSLFEELLVVDHSLGVWEGDTVDALEGGVVGVAQKVGGRVLEDCKGFDTTRMGDVGTAAEVDQGTTAVDRRRRVVRDLGLNQLQLELIMLFGGIRKYEKG